MTLFGVMPFLLYLSVLLNLGMAWLVKKSIDRSRDILEDMDSVLKSTYDLQIHLQSIYQLEMFYGDETLRDLVQHMLETNESIEELQEKYSLEEGDDLITSLEEPTETTKEREFGATEEKQIS